MTTSGLNPRRAVARHLSGRAIACLGVGALCLSAAGCDTFEDSGAEPADDGDDGGATLSNAGTDGANGGTGTGSNGSAAAPNSSVCDADRGPLDTLDILFVIDNSGSMEEEQAALARELPRMVRVLASGDLDDCDERDDCTPEEEARDFTPIEDIHLGVVSTDMGSAGQNAPNCEGIGDDGVLQAVVAKRPECSDLKLKRGFLEFNSQTDDPSELGEAFACISLLGIDGCGQEQQLEAMLKALTPGSSSIEFFGRSDGHGDTTNQGFLRSRAGLMVVLVTDEDDCSVPDQNGGLLAGHAMGDFATTPVNLRCGLHSALLYPVSRYLQGLRALPSAHVFFSAIVGIPKALEGKSSAKILDDPRMEFRADRDSTDLAARPLPSCSYENAIDPDMPQESFPPRRIVELAGELGDDAVVQSICQSNFGVPLDNIVRKAVRRIEAPDCAD